MSSSHYILHVLAEQTDPDLLVEPIANRFSGVVQDRVNGDAVLSELRRKPYSILFLDSRIQSGLPINRLLREICTEFKNLAIVLLVDDQSAADQHIHRPSTPFFHLTFPIQPAEVIFCVSHCLTFFRCKDTAASRNQKTKSVSVSGFIGDSPAMIELFEIIKRVAEDDYSTVLIRG